MWYRLWEKRLERTVEQLLERNLALWLPHFFQSEAGVALMADVSADFLQSLFTGTNSGQPWFRRTILTLVQQWAASDATFRQEIIQALNPGWSVAAAGRRNASATSYGTSAPSPGEGEETGEDFSIRHGDKWP
jgi:hypothetical protein